MNGYDHVLFLVLWTHLDMYSFSKLDINYCKGAF